MFDDFDSLDPPDAKSRLDDLQASIGQRSQEAFDQHYDEIMNSATEEEKENPDFKKKTLERCFDYSFEWGKDKVRDIINELLKTQLPDDIVCSIRIYMEGAVFEQLEFYRNPSDKPRRYPGNKEFGEQLKKALTIEMQTEKVIGELSDTVKSAILSMYQVANVHTEVYPPPIKPGAVVIPTGRLAKCQCKPDCDVDLAEPEYRVIAPEELKGRWGMDNSAQKKGKQSKKLTKKEKNKQ
ncbi:unnamed protein product [Caenorhabditis brenneri]